MTRGAAGLSIGLPKPVSAGDGAAVEGGDGLLAPVLALVGVCAGWEAGRAGGDGGLLPQLEASTANDRKRTAKWPPIRRLASGFIVLRSVPIS